ncbi:PH domain-containing protein [Cytobacillus sp. Hz8]|uniref:PH domain-containing protein n=1 Tax=Cytobacillus sp. Hz8 TaxID=3347168 RepID=UPI0035E0F71F
MNNINIEITIVGEYSTYDGIRTEAEKLPKTARQQFMKAFDTVKKNLINEKIYFLSSGAFSGTTFGYLFVTDTKAVLAEVKPFGKVKPHEIEYSDFTEIDHDILKALGITATVIELKKPGLFGSKKNKITHIPQKDFEDIYKFIKMQIS